MRSININVNDGQTHNLNKVYGLQVNFVYLNSDNWYLEKKYSSLRAVKDACNTLNKRPSKHYKYRPVKINYIWKSIYPTNCEEEKIPKKRWYTKLFRL